MSGFECEFTEEPPEYLQTHCPICLLILCEPFQVTCCGKSFCRQCIQRVRAGNKPCPTCNEVRFESFQNKGLQQPLYGFRVFCSNKESGCDWQGELGQLDQHLNFNPVGCAYTEIKCLYCNEHHPRHEIEHHQTSLCAERPFTCSLCEEYESTYADVVTNHSPVCKCRPVECPNSCGTNNLQHQHLEEHVSTQCPLSYVECEFSDAGCDAKVYRKDLPSHLGENMVAHMSLLARENRILKLQLRDQKIDNWKLKLQLEQHEEKIQDQLKEQKEALNKAVEKQRDDIVLLACVPPLDLCSDLKAVKEGEIWLSKPFYSHIGGYKLQLELQLNFAFSICYKYKYNILDSEFAVPPTGTLCITAHIKQEGKIIHTTKCKVITGKESKFIFLEYYYRTTLEWLASPDRVFHISQIEIQT